MALNLLMEKEERNREYLNKFFPSAYNIPEYGLLDRAYWFRRLIQGMNHFFSSQLDHVDLIRQVRKLDVQASFAAGRYFNTPDAPKKELIWFEESGHSLNYPEVGKFMNLLRRVQNENPN
jgi:hypothetical protein